MEVLVVSELKVMKSAAGYYVGRTTESGEPYSRESLYVSTEQQARALLIELSKSCARNSMSVMFEKSK